MRRCWAQLIHCVLWGAGIAPLLAQAPLALDTTFRCGFNDQNVNSILPLDDGTILLSGQIRYPETLTFTFRGSVKVDHNGGRVNSFPGPPFSSGGGELTRWGDKIYVATGATVRRLLGSGLLDPSFIRMNDDPIFTSAAGGDYHVYPDGRVLMTGWHQVRRTDGTWGFYNLIWFTDSGYVDTTRTPRACSGVVELIQMEPDGQFLCFYTGNEYEGQITNGRIFRINADGALDTTLQSRVTGTVKSLLPLDDGRFYATGSFNKVGVSGTIRLARFLPNGDLDTTFDNAIDFDRGTIPGNDGQPFVYRIQPWRNGRMLVLGVFQSVNDLPRGSICIVDSTGTVTEHFDNCSVDIFSYQGFHTAFIAGYLETDDGMAYIWGTYHGYNDGTTNDTLQRFVSRLYGPDTPTALESEVEHKHPFALYPNPADANVTLMATGKSTSEDLNLAFLDATGRTVRTYPINAKHLPVQLDLSALAPGSYVIVCTRGYEPIYTTRLTIQR